jgi:DNA-directed RNA polymerase subunit RPC12/RpoP
VDHGNGVYDLYVRCPHCAEGSKTFWKHNNCGGRTRIDVNEIEVFCPKCSTRGIVLDWYWRCSRHNFEALTSQGFYDLVSVIGQTHSLSTTIGRRMIQKYEKELDRRGL